MWPLTWFRSTCGGSLRGIDVIPRVVDGGRLAIDREGVNCGVEGANVPGLAPIAETPRARHAPICTISSKVFGDTHT